MREFTKSIRVDDETHALLQIESRRRNMTMSDIVREFQPGHKVSPCRYCRRWMRQPTQKHRWHMEDCVLHQDSDYRATPMAGANRKKR